METFFITVLLLVVSIYTIVFSIRHKILKNKKQVILFEFKRISTNTIMNSIIEEDILELIPGREYVYFNELFFYSSANEKLNNLSRYISNLKSAANRITEVDSRNIHNKIEKLKAKLRNETNVSYLEYTKRQIKITDDAHQMISRINNLAKEGTTSKALLLKTYSEGVCKLARMTSIKAFK